MLNVNKEPDKIYWTTGEVAEILGTSKSQLRFWCRYFEIQPIRAGDKRRFKQEEIEVFRKIMGFINEGFKLEFIKKKI